MTFHLFDKSRLVLQFQIQGMEPSLCIGVILNNNSCVFDFSFKNSVPRFKYHIGYFFTHLL